MFHIHLLGHHNHNQSQDSEYLHYNNFRYNSIIKDLKVNSYVINPEEDNTTIPYIKDQSISGIIEHNSGIVTIRIYIEWNDSEDATMDNTEDTNAATSSNGKALITTSLRFSQIKK